MEGIAFKIALVILQLLLQQFGQGYNPDTDFLFFKEGEKIVLAGEFGLQGSNDKIILCDNPIYEKCSFVNEQKIILWTSNQTLIQLKTDPLRPGNYAYFYIVKNGKPEKKGYKFMMNQIYDRVTPIDRGTSW